MKDKTFLRIEVDRELYSEYKTLVKKGNFYLKRYNNELVEKAMKEEIKELK